MSNDDSVRGASVDVRQMEDEYTNNYCRCKLNSSWRVCQSVRHTLGDWLARDLFYQAERELLIGLNSTSKLPSVKHGLNHSPMTADYDQSL